MSAPIVPIRPELDAEPWISKAEVAAHFGRTPRWVELRMREGLPHRKDGAHRLARVRFRLSEVEAWMGSRAA